jgi:hypothetical protein
VQDDDDGVITHLRSALQRVVAGEADRGTVVHIGSACENLLVKVAHESAPAVDLTGATGVTSTAQRLDDRKTLHPRALGTCASA